MLREHEAPSYVHTPLASTLLPSWLLIAGIRAYYRRCKLLYLRS